MAQRATRRLFLFHVFFRSSLKIPNTKIRHSCRGLAGNKGEAKVATGIKQYYVAGEEKEEAGKRITQTQRVKGSEGNTERAKLDQTSDSLV